MIMVPHMCIFFFFFFFEKYKALAESKQFGNLAVLFEYCYHFTTCLNSVDEK